MAVAQEKEKTRRVALITGGTRGIGQAIARSLARDGCDLVINYKETSKEEVDRLKDEADTCGVSALFIRADVTKRAAIERMVRIVKERHGRVDVLVNNAGILVKQPFRKLTEKNFDDHIATNLKGAVMVTRKVLPLLERAPKGKVIFVSSASAHNYTKESEIFSYAVSKAALGGVTRGLATELAPKILVNSVAPAYIETDMLLGEASDEENEARKSRTMLGRFGKSEEVGRLVSYLASSSADFITGQTFHINGGRYFGE
ncbi:SDR family oxidoreductase [Patescibacteria group bacterium]|nr:SDR family oxidoreductase [Patescibacteria group bacterium]